MQNGTLEGIKTVSEMAAQCGDREALENNNTLTQFEGLRRRLKTSFSFCWSEIEDFLASSEDLSRMGDSEFAEQVEEFRRLECSISGWNPAHIVKPSGSPNSALHLMLNYPTFKTRNPDSGETADATNVCTNLLIKKGLTSDNSFWYEACFRRQVPPTVRHQATATKFWPTDVKQSPHAAALRASTSFPNNTRSSSSK